MYISGRVRQFIGCLLIAGITMLYAGPVSAAVDWSQCGVEQGRTSIAVGSNTTTITPSVTLNPQKTYVMLNSSGTSGVAGGDDHMVIGTVNGFGQLVFQRGVSSSTEVYISYAAVYCQQDEFTVTSGTVALSSVATSNSAVLPSAVNSDNSLVIVSSLTNDVNSTETTSLVTGSVNSAGTTVTVSRAVSGTATTVAYQVVEFSNESGVTVQSDTVTLASGTASATDVGDQYNVPINAPLASSWLYCSWTASNSGLSQSAVGCELTDANTITLYRHASAAFTNEIRYYIVKFPADAVTVQRGAVTVDPTNDGTEYDQTVTLNNVGSATRAFSFTTNTTAGTGTALPRQRWLEEIINPTTLQFTFWHGTSANNSDEATHYWQVVKFASFYEAENWGWVGNSAQSGTPAVVGLISFNCDDLDTFYGTTCGDGTSGTRQDYNVLLEYGGCGDTCEVTGQAWVGGYDLNDSTPYTIGMIDFDPDVSSGTPTLVGDDATTTENESFDAHWNEETGELYGWARLRSLEAEESSLGGTANDWGWIMLRGKINDGSGNEYGVRFDANELQFSGWSWNDNGSQPATSTKAVGSGLGWMKFDINITNAFGIAYLETKQGDVYARDGITITTPPPAGNYGATYLVQADGSITNFSSELNSNPPGFPENYPIDSSYATINVPTDNSNLVYRGDLGTLHVNEMITRAQEQGNTQTGPCSTTLLAGKTNPLSDNTFYCDGDLTLNTNLTFYNASGTGIGSGTIVVNGDLIIQDNVTYFNNSISTHINNLASVSWIVLGDIIIEPTVTELVGAFVALDNGSGTGYVFTGKGTLPLSVSGLMIARGFTFEREDVGTSTTPQASEQIVYDGRVIANPPPGLEDFVEVLPVF